MQRYIAVIFTNRYTGFMTIFHLSIYSCDIFVQIELNTVAPRNMFFVCLLNTLEKDSNGNSIYFICFNVRVISG